MYHPDSYLRIAHDREAELIRDAQNCEVGKAGPSGATFIARWLPLVLVVTMFAATLRFLVS
jgi:hypothetical protein